VIEVTPDELVAGPRMDLSHAPLLRVRAAAEPGTGRWLALIQFHHLVLDHTGLEIVIGEIAELLAGRADRLPVPLPFRDFVGQTRLGVSREEHDEYFAGLLGDVTEPTAPFGLLDVLQDGSAAVEARLLIQPQVAARVREQAQRAGVSPATVFHLAWARVLAVLAGQDDVVFGTVLFGRMHTAPDEQRVLGLFMNTLPVRVDTAAVDVAGGLTAMRSQLAGLLAHEHPPGGGPAGQRADWARTAVHRAVQLPAQRARAGRAGRHRHRAAVGRGPDQLPAHRVGG
jgi:hypothetical protein